jgi:SAM-dependent methyltransferase
VLTIRYESLELRPEHLLLDLGCGAGRHTFEALQRGARVIAADLDDSALKDVHQVAAAMFPAPSLLCVTSDALRLPFADTTFDHIVVSEVLEHIPSDEVAMAEIERVLKPGGTLAVSVPRWWPERICWALSREYHSNDGGHVRIYRRSQLLRRLSRGRLSLTSSHHAHALHAPYWWLKCLVGVRNEDAPLVRAYHRFLVWDMESRPTWVRLIEKTLNPLAGKSAVYYLRKGAP